MNESAARDPVFDARKWKNHARQIQSPDGQVRTEKRPIVGSLRMVDPAGNVCWVPLYAGPMQKHEADPYRVSIQVAKARAGWVIYGQCPKNNSGMQHLPDEMRMGAACMGASDASPCKCVLAIIAKRQAAQAIRTAKLNGQAKTLADEQLEETRKLNQQLASALLKDRDRGDRGKAEK